jgi:hypothetical protein
MAPASAFTRDESGHLGKYSIQEERGAMDFSHDSDDSSDRARYRSILRHAELWLIVIATGLNVEVTITLDRPEY